MKKYIAIFMLFIVYNTCYFSQLHAQADGDFPTINDGPNEDNGGQGSDNKGDNGDSK